MERVSRGKREGFRHGENHGLKRHAVLREVFRKGAGNDQDFWAEIERRERGGRRKRQRLVLEAPDKPFAALFAGKMLIGEHAHDFP